jgi:hexosaminidase
MEYSQRLFHFANIPKMGFHLNPHIPRISNSFTLLDMPFTRLAIPAAFFALLLPALSQTTPLALVPMPRELRPTATQPIPQGIRITCTSCFTDSSDNFTAQDLTQSLAARHIAANGAFTIQLAHAAAPSLTPEAQAEGYTIAPAANGLILSAPTATGLFYAAQTLKQLIVGDGSSAVLHLAQIRDWPAMQYRGMHDDLSRGPIPTLAFQEQLIRTLAAYKYNTYSPYFEHTQQYASNPLFAPPGGSISPADTRALVAFAAPYHVTIIPEQEAFGHLHHNLTWEEYSDLAETPHGSVLAPGKPGSINLIGQMFTELATYYPGPFLHIGADETVDLGLGQTKADVDQRGLGPVYLDFLQQIDAKLAPLHRRLLFWGDIAQTIVQGSTAYNSVGAPSADHPDPDLLKKLPQAFKNDTIAVAWWYSPHPKNGFAKFLTPFTDAGFETWVAPGVDSWSVVFPNSNDALPNIQQFVAEGQRQHSTGMLDTVWWDDGEGLPNQNWYGLLFGAAAAWQPGVSSIEQFQQSFGPVFHGDATGDINQAEIELMACHQILRESAKVGDASDGLFWIDPWSPDGQKVAAKLRPYLHDYRLHAERALTLIANARAAYPAPTSDTPSSAAEGSASTAVTYNAANAFPSNPTSLRHPNAIDALELGARRMDFIGLKFQLADEIVDGYNRALADLSSTDKKQHQQTGKELSDIRGANGRLEDIRDTYGLLRDLYAQSWLRTNRAYALRPVLSHYDDTVSLWNSRIDRFRSVQRQLENTKTLPTPFELGLPTH